MDFDSSLYRAINSSIARSLFVTAWADREEREGRTYPGEELTQVAPATPHEAELEAARLIGRLESANRMGLAAIYAQACKADGVDYGKVCEMFREDMCDEQPDLLKHVEEFGFSIGQTALGTGVAWTDNHEAFEINDGIAVRYFVVPSIEVHLDDDPEPKATLRPAPAPTGIATPEFGR